MLAVRAKAQRFYEVTGLQLEVVIPLSVDGQVPHFEWLHLPVHQRSLFSLHRRIAADREPFPIRTARYAGHFARIFEKIDLLPDAPLPNLYLLVRTGHSDFPSVARECNECSPVDFSAVRCKHLLSCR